MILFYSDACPHCHNQLEWMAEIEEDFPRISFERFEIQVSNDRENQEYFQTVMEAYGSNARGWPRTVIGDRVFIGFAAETGDPIYNEDYQAWIGYRNQLRSALEQLHDAGGTES
jgi:glutaredoxin